MKAKLTSRKFWAAVAGAVTGIAMIFGLDEGIISTVSGAVVTIASVLGYIIVEGKIDADALFEVVDKILKALAEAVEYEETESPEEEPYQMETAVAYINNSTYPQVDLDAGKAAEDDGK